jgi:carbonic anhydrase
VPDVIYRFDPDESKIDPAPADADEARARLLKGNRSFVNVFTETEVIHVAPSSIGIGSGDGPPQQRPFASILACADARVPVELIFRCGSNELFVVRVAGNVPGQECLGSLEFASATMAESIRLAVVIGHTACGAVSAAVDTYLDQRNCPESAALRAIVDRILPAVSTADSALEKCHGGRTAADSQRRSALIRTSVTLNAALSAMAVRDALGEPVEYGIFDLTSREVNLTTPPRDADAYVRLADEVVASDPVREVLGA